MADDDELFEQEMGDVTPLRSAARQHLVKAALDADTARRRREAAAAEVEGSHTLATHDIPLLDAWVPLEFKRPGVQNGVFRRLKQGRYAWDARLDLHRRTVEQAGREVEAFIVDATAHDLRCVLVIHGKAEGRGKAAVLKSYVNLWLPELAPVQAFCSAQLRDGGTGAVYVLLKKSERGKQQNRDRLRRG